MMGRGPKWMATHLWNELVETHRLRDDYMEKCKQSQTSRMADNETGSIIRKHTCDSIPHEANKQGMRKDRKRKTTDHIELFEQCDSEASVNSYYVSHEGDERRINELSRIHKELVKENLKMEEKIQRTKEEILRNKEEARKIEEGREMVRKMKEGEGFQEMVRNMLLQEIGYAKGGQCSGQPRLQGGGSKEEEYIRAMARKLIQEMGAT